MKSIHVITHMMYDKFSRINVYASIALGIALSSNFGLASMTIRFIKNTTLPNELERYVNKCIIPSGIAFVITLLLGFFLGKMLSKTQGFRRFASAFGASYIISAISSIALVAFSSIGSYVTKQYPALNILLLLFLMTYVATLIYSIYFVYFIVAASYGAGRMKSIIFVIILLAPSLVVAQGWQKLSDEESITAKITTQKNTSKDLPQ